MKIRMKVDISGTHDGEDWPRRGEVADLANNVATDLISAGMAEPATQAKVVKNDVETTTMAANEETRSTPVRRGRRPRV